jgi:hypothetical protein
MSAPAATKKVRAAKRKTTPSKEAPKAKRGDGQRVSANQSITKGIHQDLFFYLLVYISLIHDA